MQAQLCQLLGLTWSWRSGAQKPRLPICIAHFHPKPLHGRRWPEAGMVLDVEGCCFHRRLVFLQARGVHVRQHRCLHSARTSKSREISNTNALSRGAPGCHLNLASPPPPLGLTTTVRSRLAAAEHKNWQVLSAGAGGLRVFRRGCGSRISHCSPTRPNMKLPTIPEAGVQAGGGRQGGRRRPRRWRGRRSWCRRRRWRGLAGVGALEV